MVESENVSTNSTKVGVLGLGAMGSRYARRLLESGYRVSVYNRTPHRAPELDALGVRRVSSPAELAAASDVIVISVFDAHSLETVFRAEEGLLSAIRQDHILLDTTTVHPDVSAALARKVAERGGWMLDTPVSGSLDAAESGSLLVMASGSLRALEKARPVLSAFARKIIHVGGDNGGALAVKLAINAQIAMHLSGFGEALRLTRSRGVDDRVSAEAMLESVISSPVLQYRVPFLFDPPEEVWANCHQLLKDLSYAVDSLQDRNVDSPDRGSAWLMLAAREYLGALVTQGQGDSEAYRLITAAAEISSSPL